MQCNNLIDYFPKDSIPRDSQIKVLHQIENAINSGTKFIILQAPTGSGKSHIAATLANYSNPINNDFKEFIESNEAYKKDYSGEYLFANDIQNLSIGGSVILTVTKALQDQYERLFPDIISLKGKQNYTCSVDDDFSCDFAPCTLTHKLFEQCYIKKACPYLEQRKKALLSKFCVYNYSSYMTLPDFLTKRQIIIADEASELEDELVGMYSCTINYKNLDILGISYQKLTVVDTNFVHNWLNDILQQISTIKTEIEGKIRKKSTKLNKGLALSLFNRFRSLTLIEDDIITIIKNWFKTEYVIDLFGTHVDISPLYVNIFAQRFFNQADLVVLMSGTIIDHKTYAQTLGITNYKYIEIDSEFDSNKSPIYCCDQFKLNHKNIDNVLPCISEIAISICEKHSNEKGIIHTHNFKITDFLRKRWNNKRFLFRESGITNEHILDEHKLCSNTVLISPSLAFGIDLGDDEGRFGIIMKAPYLPLNNTRIKKLAENNHRWYIQHALKNLVQMCGRTTRSKDDHSTTYILDGQAVDLIREYKDLLPKWFLSRLH